MRSKGHRKGSRTKRSRKYSGKYSRSSQKRDKAKKKRSSQRRLDKRHRFRAVSELNCSDTLSETLQNELEFKYKCYEPKSPSFEGLCLSGFPSHVKDLREMHEQFGAKFQKYLYVYGTYGHTQNCCSDWFEGLGEKLRPCVNQAKEELPRHKCIVAVSRSCQVVLRSLLELKRTDIHEVNMIAPEIYEDQVQSLKACFDMHRNINFNIFLTETPSSDLYNKDLSVYIDKIKQKQNVNVYVCAIERNDDKFNFMGHGNVQLTVKSAFEIKKSFDLDGTVVTRTYFNRDKPKGQQMVKYNATIRKVQ